MIFVTFICVLSFKLNETWDGGAKAVFVLQDFGFLFKEHSTYALEQVLKINPRKKDINCFEAADFELIGYDPHPKIEMKMAV